MPVLELILTPAGAIGLAAVVGLLVGSFLNVVILRLPARLMHRWREESRELLQLDVVADAPLPPAPPASTEPAPPGIVVEGSHCPHCKHKLGALENIPVLSWVALRGRCRHCGAPISVQYPIVELLTCIACALVAWRFGPTWQTVAGFLFTCTLIALAGIDVRTQLLPDQMTLPLLWLGLLAALVPLYIGSGEAIAGAAIGYLSLWTIYWGFKLVTGKEGMGYGDFKLLGALGAWMGGWSLLPIVLLSSVFGAIVGGTLLAVQGRDRATPIPFGPFLAAAGWTQFVFGPELSALYRHLFFP